MTKSLPHTAILYKNGCVSIPKRIINELNLVVGKPVIIKIEAVNNE